MKILKAFLYASLLFSGIVLQAQTNNGPMVSPKMNGTYYVGVAPYTTIQSTVTAACVANVIAKVVISANITPSDTITGTTSCAKVSLEDQRVSPSVVYITNGTTFSATPTAVAAKAAADSASTAATTAQTAANTAFTKATTPFGGSGINHSLGVVPDPGSSAGTTRFLREDGTWTSTPSTGITNDGNVTTTPSSTTPGAYDLNANVPVFSGSGTNHKAGVVPDPGSSAGGYRVLSEDGSFKNAMQAGQPAKAYDYVDPLTPPSQNSYPIIMPWVEYNFITRRQTYNDAQAGHKTVTQFQHGGGNITSNDFTAGGLATTNITGNFMNTAGFINVVTTNTDTQVGGAFDQTLNCYGHGDCIPSTRITNGTGGSRGTDEHLEASREYTQWHGDSWGIVVATMTSDATGHGFFHSPIDGNSVPYASTNHSLLASSENAPIINTNPAKIYSTGNVSKIDICPNGLIPNTQFYMCLTGDSAAAWTQKYGISKFTQLTIEIDDGVVNGVDRFAGGPVMIDASVADPSAFTVGQPFTISSGADNFEQPSVISINTSAKTIRAYFSKPHAANELMTSGGAVGHAIEMTADQWAPGTLPGIQNSNASTLHMPYPVVASFANNIQAVYVNSAGSFGNEYKTRGMNANTPSSTGVFSINLDGTGKALQIDNSGATQPGWSVTSYGNYYASSLNAGGNDQLPMPVITFTGTGSSCVLPTAHFVYLFASNALGITPVTDTAGSNCDGLAFTFTNVWANPYAEFPMVWARSNRDPNYSDPTNYLTNFKGFNASTSGYMMVDSLTSEFAVNDSVEIGMWWNKYISSNIGLFGIQGKSRRNSSNGGSYNIIVGGVTGSALFRLINPDSPYDFYGTLANGFTPDNLKGYGRHEAPIGFSIQGPNSVTWDAEIPRTRAGDGVFHTASVVRARCINPLAPCYFGDYQPYNIGSYQGKNGTLNILYDSAKNYLFFSQYGPDLLVGFQSMKVVPSSSTTYTYTQFPTCTDKIEFSVRSAYGYFGGRASQQYECLNIGTGFSWISLTPPPYESYQNGGTSVAIVQANPTNTILLSGNTTVSVDSSTPIHGDMCIVYISNDATFASHYITYPGNFLGWQQPHPPAQYGTSVQCGHWVPSQYYGQGAWMATSSMYSY